MGATATTAATARDTMSWAAGTFFLVIYICISPTFILGPLGMSIWRWQQQQQWLETFTSRASGMCFLFYFIYFTIVHFRSTQHAEMATIAGFKMRCVSSPQVWFFLNIYIFNYINGCFKLLYLQTMPANRNNRGREGLETRRVSSSWYFLIFNFIYI